MNAVHRSSHLPAWMRSSRCCKGGQESARSAPRAQSTAGAFCLCTSHGEHEEGQEGTLVSPIWPTEVGLEGWSEIQSNGRTLEPALCSLAVSHCAQPQRNTAISFIPFAIFNHSGKQDVSFRAY